MCLIQTLAIVEIQAVYVYDVEICSWEKIDVFDQFQRRIRNKTHTIHLSYYMDFKMPPFTSYNQTTNSFNTKLSLVLATDVGGQSYAGSNLIHTDATYQLASWAYHPLSWCFLCWCWSVEHRGTPLYSHIHKTHKQGRELMTCGWIMCRWKVNAGIFISPHFSSLPID